MTYKNCKYSKAHWNPYNLTSLQLNKNIIPIMMSALIMKNESR